MCTNNAEQLKDIYKIHMYIPKCCRKNLIEDAISVYVTDKFAWYQIIVWGPMGEDQFKEAMLCEFAGI